MSFMSGRLGFLLLPACPESGPGHSRLQRPGPGISARSPCRQRPEQPRARPPCTCRCECNIVGVWPRTASLPRGQGNGTGRAPAGGYGLLRFPCFRSHCGGGCSRIAQPPQRPDVSRSPNARTWLRQAFSHRQGSIVLTQCRFEHDDDGQQHPKLLISLQAEASAGHARFSTTGPSRRLTQPPLGTIAICASPSFREYYCLNRYIAGVSFWLARAL